MSTTTPPLAAVYQCRLDYPCGWSWPCHLIQHHSSPWDHLASGAGLRGPHPQGEAAIPREGTWEQAQHQVTDQAGWAREGPQVAGSHQFCGPQEESKSFSTSLSSLVEHRDAKANEWCDDRKSATSSWELPVSELGRGNATSLGGDAPTDSQCS